MKDETAGVAIKEFVGLKPKMYSFIIGDSSEHKKAKIVKKNVVATVSHGKYKDVFWTRNVWDIWWIELKVKIIE